MANFDGWTIRRILFVYIADDKAINEILVAIRN